MSTTSNQEGLTGLVPPERIRPQPGRVSGEMIRRLDSVQDLSATVADILDGLGVESAVGASELKPSLPERRVIGTAVTVRKVAQRRAAALDAAASRADMGEIEGANQCRAGDVLVIQGLPGISAMGGVMSTMAKRQGVAGAVIDGGVRDLGHARAIGFPLWSTHVTPVTGKWRSEVVEINGAVTVHGRIVKPGDLVIADETGVVFVPQDLIEPVVQRVEAIARAEQGFRSALESDAPLYQLVRAYLKQRAAKGAAS